MLVALTWTVTARDGGLFVLLTFLTGSRGQCVSRSWCHVVFINS